MHNAIGLEIKLLLLLHYFNIAFYHDTLDGPSSATNEHNGIQAGVLYNFGIKKILKQNCTLMLYRIFKKNNTNYFLIILNAAVNNNCSSGLPYLGFR